MADNNNTPQLGELAAAGQSQAPVATIAPTDSSQLVQTLNQNARFKAQNDWNKYLNFQENLKQAYANVAQVEQMEVMGRDKEELQEDAAKLYNFIAKNPDAFSGRDPQLTGEMQAMYGNLMSKATLSKQDNIFDKANRAYLVQNNELNTDENKSLIEGFAETPLGGRKAYTLSLEPIFDAGTFSETLKTNIGKQYSPSQKTAPTNFDPATGKYTPGEDYIRTTETVTIPFKDYMERWNASLSMQTDKNNQPVKKWAEKQYNTLPEDVKQKVSMEDFWNKIGERLYGSDRDEQGNVKDIVKTTKDELKENSNFLKKDKLALDQDELKERIRHNKAMEGLGWANLKFDKDKLAKANVSEAQATEAKDYAAGVFSKLQGLANADGIIEGDKLQQLTADELKYLGTSTTEDNKFTIKPLDVSGKKLKVNANGTVQVVSDKSHWFKPNEKNVPTGKTIDIKNVALNKLGDVLVTSTGKEGASYETLKDLYNAKPADKSGKIEYNYKGKVYTEAQIAEKAKASGMTVEEYKNELGIQ